jgi:hypothetical protein
MPTAPDAPRTATLTERLGELYRQAHQLDGRPVRIDLARGLRIALKVSLEGETWMQISRHDTFPAVAEWTTVMNHFPGGAEQIGDIQAGEDKGIYWMRARIRVTPQMI